ncbi:hypothetical protein GJ496_001796 [Pomphorhynchus laevis]|nr:hypothetical protein GJ496_001796 [Pomphorhynchus laevis]
MCRAWKLCTGCSAPSCYNLSSIPQSSLQPSKTEHLQHPTHTAHENLLEKDPPSPRIVYLVRLVTKYWQMELNKHHHLWITKPR